MFHPYHTYVIDMKNEVLDHEFFRKYCLHICLHTAGITRYEMVWDEPDSEMVTKLVASAEKEIEKFRLMAEKEEELFPKDENGWAEYGVNRGAYDDQLEYLNSVRVMLEIQSIWDSQVDVDFSDEWFAERYEEYIKALYSQPTDELANFVPSIDFHGKKLAYWNSRYRQGICLRKDSDLERIYKSDLNYAFFDRLTPEDMSVPFDAHNIWDALLLLLSIQWMWKPEMYIVCPGLSDGKRILPRVTIHGDKALATFCSVGPQTNKENDIRSLYKNAILLQRNEKSFEMQVN